MPIGGGSRGVSAARIATLVLAAAFLLAACGGEEDAGTTLPATSEAPGTGTQPAVTSGGPPGSDGQPAIVVAAPASGATVSSPMTVSGTADVFEATVTVIVRNADGEEVARDFTTATCGTGCRGDYTLDLSFTVDSEQPGTIVVQDDDAAGMGTPPHVAEVPVTLAPE